MQIAPLDRHNRKAPTIIPVAAGKGGVGKTMLTANLAIALSRLGLRTIAIDLDLGGSNLHHFFGLGNRHPGIGDFLKAKKGELADYIRPLFKPVLGFIPGDGKTPFMANIAHAQKIKLINCIKKLDADFILLDLGAGSDYNTLDFFAIGPRGIMVTTPEYPAVLGMLGFLKQHLLRIIERRVVKNRTVHLLLKNVFNNSMNEQVPSISRICKRIAQEDVHIARIVHSEYQRCRPRIVFNRGRKPEDAGLAEKISCSLSHILDIEADFFGFIFEDAAISAAVKNRVPMILHHDTSMAAENVRKIALRIKKYWQMEIPDSAQRLYRNLKAQNYKYQ
jgi:flagellar biosynthesis protein FlhG